MKLFAYYSYFIRRGLIDYDMKTIKATFVEGMDLAAESSEYCDNLDEELSRIGIDVGDDMEEIINGAISIDLTKKPEWIKDYMLNPNKIEFILEKKSY